jgi:hypothetical protein
MAYSQHPAPGPYWLTPCRCIHMWAAAASQPVCPMVRTSGCSRWLCRVLLLSPLAGLKQVCPHTHSWQPSPPACMRMHAPTSARLQTVKVYMPEPGRHKPTRLPACLALHDTGRRLRNTLCLCTPPSNDHPYRLRGCALHTLQPAPTQHHAPLLQPNLHYKPPHPPHTRLSPVTHLSPK